MSEEKSKLESILDLDIEDLLGPPAKIEVIEEFKPKAEKKTKKPSLRKFRKEKEEFKGDEDIPPDAIRVKSTKIRGIVEDLKFYNKRGSLDLDERGRIEDIFNNLTEFFTTHKILRKGREFYIVKKTHKSE